MKKLLLSFLAIGVMQASFSQTCNELFISEYIEGSGNNKAIEIYNPTGQAIDLSGYAIARGSNGAFPVELTFTRIPSGNTIQSHSTYVIVLDKRDPNGTGNEAPVNADLAIKADVFLCPVYAENQAMYFNGNDAVVLYKGTDVNTAIPVDIFGKPGEDPGQSWTDDASAGYTDANGGVYWTKDQTLIRKKSVKQGVKQIPSQFNPTLQWDSLPNNTFSELGQHICDCSSSSLERIDQAISSLYPNPASQGFSIETPVIATSIEVYDLIGNKVAGFKPSQRFNYVPASNWNSGIYFVKVESEGKISVKKLTVK